MTHFDDRSTGVLFKGPKPAFWIFLVVLLIALVSFLEVRYPPPPVYKSFGIVVSAGPIAIDSHSSGTHQSASVRLTDGATVPADARLVEPLSNGDGVTVLVHPARFGAPSYEIIKRNRQ